MEYILRVDIDNGVNNCGLPRQDTDWVDVSAATWEGAVREARMEFNKYPERAVGGVLMYKHSPWPQPEKIMIYRR